MNKARMLLIAGAVGVIAASGSAFTDAVTFGKASQTVGYGTQTVSGATASQITYNINTTGDNIDTVTIKLQGDLSSGYTVGAAFNSDALTSCGSGTYDGSTATTFTCGSYTQSPQTATAFHVSVVQAG